MSEYKAKAKAFKAGLEAGFEAKASLEDYNTGQHVTYAVLRPIPWGWWLVAEDWTFDGSSHSVIICG